MFNKEYVENLIKNEKHFCMAPWVHTHISSGCLSPCILYKMENEKSGYGSLKEKSFDELWQGENIRKIRLKMLKGENISQCMECYENKFGTKTLRDKFNKYYAKYSDWVINTDDRGFSPDAKPVSWELQFSSLCNLKCRSCNSWVKGFENVELNLRNINKKVDNVDKIEKLLGDIDKYIPIIEKIKFNGGEPLLINENYSILKKLDQYKKYDVHMEFETNLTCLNDDILSLWNKFNNVQVSISMDGYGSKCEYLRKGLRWDDVLNNLELIKLNCPKVKIRINYTVSAYNIMHLPDFHKEIVGNKYISAEKIHLIYANKPAFFSAKVLPTEIKNMVTEKIQDHIRWLRQQHPFNSKEGLLDHSGSFFQWLVCIKQMNDDDWTHLISDFVNYSNKLDEIRNEKCHDFFPELKPLFEKNKNMDDFLFGSLTNIQERLLKKTINQKINIYQLS